MAQKETNVIFRLTEQEKTQFKEYCEKHNIKMSEFIRNTILNKIQQEENIK